MMSFHVTVPRTWLGSNGSSMGERVRHVNIRGEEKENNGKRKLVSLFTELSNVSDIQKLKLKILVLYFLSDDYNGFDMQSKGHQDFSLLNLLLTKHWQLFFKEL